MVYAKENDSNKKIIQVKEDILIDLSPQLESLQRKQKNINQIINENDNINNHNNSISNAIKNKLIYNKINAFYNNKKQVIKKSITFITIAYLLLKIGYASRKILSNDKTYSSTTLELLGLVFCVTYFDYTYDNLRYSAIILVSNIKKKKKH